MIMVSGLLKILSSCYPVLSPMPVPWKESYENDWAVPMLDLCPEYLDIVRHLFGIHLPDVEVWAYGSRVTGGAHQGSDLDLVVRHPSDLPISSQQLFTLKDAISESNLPILVDVLDWALIPESFRREIEKAHVVVREVIKNT